MPTGSGALLEDLAILLGEDRAIYIRLGPENAILTVKSPTTFAFGDTFETNWGGMTAEARAQALLDWISRAADYCRNPRIRQVLKTGAVA